jgi:ABC-type microcin C transport system permease subunit YejE
LISVLLGILLLLLCILIGFSVGRRLGYYDGVEHGRALASIELREQSLREGTCPICDR